MTDAATDADVIVLGAGPAGVPAALAAAGAGATVILIDANERAGGQYHRQLPSDFEVADPGALHHGWRTAAAGFDALQTTAAITHVAGARAWLVERRAGRILVHTTGSRRTTVSGRTLVLATGATERSVPFPGWDLPGVMTVGAAQALVKGQGVRPGHRVLVAGTGPLLLASASTLLRAGTNLLQVLDANGPANWRAVVGPGLLAPGKAWEGAGYLRDLARTRTPYRHHRAVVRVEGDRRVERATIAQVDDAWHIIPGSEEHVEVDAVCVAYGFTPNLGIPAALGCELSDDAVPAVTVNQLQSTSVPGVFAAGELTGVAGASVASIEGAVAGSAAAVGAGYQVDRTQVRRLARRLRRERRLAAALLRAAPLRDGWTTWLAADTIVCRCEEVPYAKVRAAITELRARDIRSVKMTTRCGMGACQAAICGPSVVDLVRTATGATPPDATGLLSRSIAESVALGEL